MNTIYDTILWLQSQKTGRRFPIVQFSADTDMATDGWVSLTSVERSDVVVTQLTNEEYRSTAAGAVGGYLQLEERVNAALHRNDLRHSWLVRVEEKGPSGMGLSFQEFRKVYQPPKLFYRDILSAGGVAEEISRVSRSQFEREGGSVVVLP